MKECMLEFETKVKGKIWYDQVNILNDYHYRSDHRLRHSSSIDVASCQVEKIGKICHVVRWRSCLHSASSMTHQVSHNTSADQRKDNEKRKFFNKYATNICHDEMCAWLHLWQRWADSISRFFNGRMKSAHYEKHHAWNRKNSAKEKWNLMIKILSHMKIYAEIIRLVLFCCYGINFVSNYKNLINLFFLSDHLLIENHHPEYTKDRNDHSLSRLWF